MKNSRYYINLAPGNSWEEVKGRKLVVEGWQDLDLFTYKKERGGCSPSWVVSEGSTGGKVCEVYKYRNAQERAKQVLDKVGREQVDSIIKEAAKRALSPRYNE